MRRMHLTRRGRVVFFGLPVSALFLWALVSMGLLSPVNMPGVPQKPETAVPMVVQGGDSLWLIAGRSGSSRPAGDVVADIVQLNNLKSAVLEPGQTLLVPTQ